MEKKKKQKKKANSLSSPQLMVNPLMSLIKSKYEYGSKFGGFSLF